jgi:hypothetical protein
MEQMVKTVVESVASVRFLWTLVTSACPFQWTRISKTRIILFVFISMVNWVVGLKLLINMKKSCSPTLPHPTCHQEPLKVLDKDVAESWSRTSHSRSLFLSMNSDVIHHCQIPIQQYLFHFVWDTETWILKHSNHCIQRNEMETLASYRINKELINFRPNIIIIFQGLYHFRMMFQNNVHKMLFTDAHL